MGLSHGAAGLRASEHLLDPLSDFLGEAVAGVAYRAPFDGGTPVIPIPDELDSSGIG